MFASLVQRSMSNTSTLTQLLVKKNYYKIYFSGRYISLVVRVLQGSYIYSLKVANACDLQERCEHEPVSKWVWELAWT